MTQALPNLLTVAQTEPIALRDADGNVIEAVPEPLNGPSPPVSSLALPVLVYDGATLRMRIDDSTAPGFVVFWFGAAASAPSNINYAMAFAEDNSQGTIGEGITEIVFPTEIAVTSSAVFEAGIYQFYGGGFISGGGGQAWAEAVSNDFAISSGPHVVDPATYANPIIRLVGTLDANGTLEFPNQIGAVWDLDLSDANLLTNTLTLFCGANVVNVALAGNVIGVRIACTKSGYLVAMGAPST